MAHGQQYNTLCSKVRQLKKTFYWAVNTKRAKMKCKRNQRMKIRATFTVTDSDVWDGIIW